MILRRSTFFLLIFIIIITASLAPKIVWLLHSKKAMGKMHFVGKTYTGQLVHFYSVISFMAGKDTIWFNGIDNVLFRHGDTVPVRYPPDDPYDARIDAFVPIWGDALVYGGSFLLLAIVISLHRGIVPRRSKIRLMLKRPFIQVV